MYRNISGLFDHISVDSGNYGKLSKCTVTLVDYLIILM